MTKDLTLEDLMDALEKQFTPDGPVSLGNARIHWGGYSLHVIEFNDPNPPDSEPCSLYRATLTGPSEDTQSEWSCTPALWKRYLAFFEKEEHLQTQQHLEDALLALQFIPEMPPNARIHGED